ncbi:MAG: hypothetical protein HY912_02765 [Desulfomonile tiedjei]|uniref:UDP-N-acetylmuramyl pentapeptide phosphotransferase/UDP-N-acetylglucosamine-1-phosphate transferase n=1 Tax=Desulfomonile tiedjei TaxID=2358 RepID=A0A9D6UY13_9BACT|nr:hypothetical protein [Desulfomonile tiedjei]
MRENLLLITAVGLFGFLATLLSIPFFQRTAIRYKILSYPGGRKNHDNPTPLLGGISIYLPFAIVFCVVYSIVLAGSPLAGRLENTQMLSLFLGTTFIHALGTYDDIASISWKTKLAGQLCAIGILLLGGHTVATATLPFIGPVDFGWFGHLIFLTSILTITNGINLIDGMDGLAGGICFFAAITSAIIGLFKGDLFTALAACTISGSLLGFLRYNFPPASIYMGDGGSLMLGFLLGTLATSCAAISPGQRSGTMGMILIPFLPFGIALLDVILAVIRRWVTGRRIFLADADHLHHRLMERFGKPRQVAVILYFFSALLSAMTLVLVLGPRSELAVRFIVVAGTIWLVVVVAVLRLYRVGTLSKTLENRPHLQFLSSYHGFMSKRISRAQSLDELISLLESGVRDLECDSVDVFYGDRVIKSWMNPRKAHEEAPRIEGEKNFDGLRFHVRWVFPIHESETYQNYLLLTWYRVVNELESRIHTFAGKSRLYEWMTDKKYAHPNEPAMATALSAAATTAEKPFDLEPSSAPFYVVTVNYNSGDHLKRLASSLVSMKYLKELIIVNHSGPESIGRLDAPFPIRIIHQKNLGYGAGINRGLLEISEPAAVTLACNPDITIVNPEVMREAIAYLIQNTTVACLFPTLVDLKFLPVHSCRQFYTLKTLLAVRIPWLRNNPPNFLREHFYMNKEGTEPFEVDWGSGAAMLFKNVFFPEPLSFDEKFFLYFEDVDLCTKAWQHGLPVVFFPKMVCLHDAHRQSHHKLSFFIRHVLSLVRYVRKYQGLPKRELLLRNSQTSGHLC